MAVLLLSVHSLLNQCLLHLHSTHLTDFPTARLQLTTVLALDQNISTRTAYHRGSKGHARLLVSLVTN